MPPVSQIPNGNITEVEEAQQQQQQPQVVSPQELVEPTEEQSMFM